MQSANINRRFPPLGYYDTVTIKDGVLTSIHPPAQMFRDKDIHTIHQGIELQPPTTNEQSVLFQVTRNEMGKYVLQQQSTRGCTAGVVAMLLLDHQAKIDPEEMASSNLGTNEEMLSSLANAGLHPIESQLPWQVDISLIWLNEALKEHGSAIVTMDSDQMGSHVVIVDSIHDEVVRLRDPYHGWDISVTKESFTKYWQPLSGIIQIKDASK